jgi:aryl-alcohol dehydrogenase-like predicted oxidoreductase
MRLTRLSTSTSPFPPHISSIDRVHRVEEVAKKKGVPMAQIAIAWTLARGIAAPIIGTTSLKNLEEAVEAVKVKLTPEEIKELEAPYVPRPIVGIFN